MLLDLYQSGDLPNVQSIDVEPVYGYSGRILYRNGSVRLYKGSCLGINNLGASEISKDKGYTKYFLQRLGYDTPQGEVFLFPRFITMIDKNLKRFGFNSYRSATTAETYIRANDLLPCYIKPNEGSQGRGVVKCLTIDDVKMALRSFEASGALKVLIEKEVPFPDYRVVILSGEIISCYRRRALAVTGDGTSTIFELIKRKQDEFYACGRDTMIFSADPRIDQKLLRIGYSRNSVPSSGETVELIDISNLSAGGQSEDYTERIHSNLMDVCISITSAFGLQLAGIDIACEDIEAPSSIYSVIEVNAAPGVDNYAAAGKEQTRIVRSLYRKIFNTPA